MKRPYYRKRNSFGAPLWTYGVAVFVVILLILARVFAPGTFANLATPVWTIADSFNTAVRTTSAGFESKGTLDQQNVRLAEEVQTLTNQNEALDARNQDLTKLLGGQSTTTAEILAGVIAAPPESPYDTLTISGGSNGGINEGALVYSAGGIPIGTITHLNENTSQVSLFSTPGRITSGWIGANRIPVTLTGMGAGAFSATVTASTTINVGDTVYVPGPGALPIGTVVSVKTDPSSPSPTVEIQPTVNLFSITWVEVERSE